MDTAAAATSRPDIRPLVTFAALALIGAGIGALSQFAPWGNGFFGGGLCLAGIITILLIFSLLGRFTNLPKVVKGWTATGIAVIAVSVLTFASARPPRDATLAYMIGRPLPANVQCDRVRRQWSDGAIYIAAFHADAPAVEAIVSARPYEKTDALNKEGFRSHWRGDFQLGQIADPSWLQPPAVTSPRIYLWAMPSRGPGSKSEFAALLVDDADGRCRMLYALDLLSSPESTF